MKALFVLALLASCRWHFDAVGTSDGGSPDRPGDDAAAPMVVYATSGPNGGAPRLIEVDLATGEVTERGLLGVSYILSGLAYWDATTLYATSVTGDLVSIDLATRSTTVVRTIGGVVSSLERDNGDLIGVDEATDELVRFTPAGGVTRTPVTDGASTVMAQGGDLARASDGTWYWWSNVTMQLYTLDVTTGRVVAVGAPIAGPFVGGLVIDRDDHLFMLSSSPDELLELDRTTGSISSTRPLCQPCPTTYDLLSGDATRSP